MIFTKILEKVISASFLFALRKPTGRKTGKGMKMEEYRMDTQTGEKDTQQGEKTFTQEEVNRIVQERLARVKAEPSGKEEELNKREKDLSMRELKMTARELFAEKKLPAELLEVLDYSDESRMKKHIDILESTYRSTSLFREPQQVRREVSYGGYTPASGTTAYRETDSIRKAMGLK